MMGLLQRNEGRWRVVLLLTGLLLSMTSRSFAIQMTTVRDTVYRADGTAAQGTVLVSWPSFTAGDGSTVAAGSTSVALAADGSLTLALTPNAGSSPQGTYYTAVYHLNDGTVQKEYWVVPTGGTATVTQIRAQVVPAAVAQQTVSKQYVDAEVRSLQSAYLPMAGGTMTGNLLLSGDPSSSLQAATKQYVDAHAGGTVATLAGVTGNFSTSVSSVRTLLGTTFNEGAAGATIAGTTPATYTCTDTWHFGDGSTTWNFSASGAVSASTSGAPYIGAYIDVCQSDGYTIQASFAGVGSGSLLAVRANPADGSMIFLNLTAGNVQWIAQSGGSQTFLSNTAGLDVSTLSVTVSGQTVTASDGAGRSLAATSSLNPSSTLIAFTNYGGAPATLTSLSVTVPATVRSTCNGVMSGDGNCSPTQANTFVAADAGGHIAPLPEIQTQTDGSGNVTIQCSEDRSKGIFDPRCPAYGNGGVNGPNPAQAWQEVADAANCWGSIHGRMATIDGPAGTWSVGLVNEPVLTFGPVNFHGAPGGQYGATRFNSTFKTTTTVQFVTPYTAPCVAIPGVSPTLMVTNGMQGGAVTNLSQHGCANGGCINLPGDNGDPLNQLNQAGIFVGYVHAAEIGPLYSELNLGTGVIIGGLDVIEKGGIFSYNDQAYLQRDHAAGSSYNPATDGMHYQVDLASGDSRYFHIEAYGFESPVGQEYGHVASIGLEGGNVYLEDIFPQVGQVGLWRPYGGGYARVHGMRIDAMGGASVVNADPLSTFIQGLFDGYCQSSTVPQPCDAIANSGIGQSSFVHINLTRSGFFGPSYASGDISSAFQQYYEDITADNGGPVFEPNDGQPGLGVSYRQPDYGQAGGNCLTGTTPSVRGYTHVQLCNASATTVTDFTDALVGQDLSIFMSNANQIIATTANGGVVQSCSGNNIVGPGLVHLQAITVYADHARRVFQEQCGSSNVLAIGAAPASSSAPCFTGQVVDAPGNPTGYKYYCDSANHWIRETTTWNTF